MNPEKLTKRQVENLLAEAHQDRQFLQDRFYSIPQGKEKAMVANRIRNRESIINKLNKLLEKFT